MTTFQVQLFYPVFALFLLTVIVLLTMGKKRFQAAKTKSVDIKFYTLYRDGAEPDDIRKLSRNFQNLFETPVHFYLGVVLTMILAIESNFLIYLAWGYVVLRYLHSYVHCTSNHVRTRFNIYLTSVAVLTTYWITLLTKVIQAGV